MSTSPELQFEHTRGCLLVRISGRSAIDRKEATVKAVAAAITARPVQAVLVDMRQVDGPYQFMDRYQLGELAGQYLNKVPIAVLALEAQTDPRRIGKIVANNRGAQLEVFTDPEAAREWLLKFYTIPESDRVAEDTQDKLAEFIAP